MNSNNKIQAIIYLILVVILCASLVGVISNISKRAEELFGGGNDNQNSTSTTAKPTTTKPAETTKPVETCEHDYVNGVCTRCNAECEHIAYIDGFCSDCGVREPCLSVYCYDEDEDGYCDDCGSSMD